MLKVRFVKTMVAALACCMVLAACGTGNQPASSAQAPSTPAEEAPMVVRVGAKEDGQPYIYTENGEVKGFEADMWKEISKRANLTVEYKYNSISGLFGLLDTGELDTISHFLGKTAQRAEKYDFTDVYGSAVLQLMVKKDAAEIKAIEELHGKKVGVALGSAAAGVLQKLDPDGKIEIVPYEEFRNIPQDVEMGRIDAYFGNTITMLGDIKKMNLDCKINPLVLHGTEVAYPLSRTNEKSAELAEKINAALKEMAADGTTAKISEQWLGIDITKTSK